MVAGWRREGMEAAGMAAGTEPLARKVVVVVLWACGGDGRCWAAGIPQIRAWRIRGGGRRRRRRRCAQRGGDVAMARGWLTTAAQLAGAVSPAMAVGDMARRRYRCREAATTSELQMRMAQAAATLPL